MLSIVNSGVLIGIEAQAVQIEVNTGERGEPKMLMVGLPGSSVRESMDRVRSALDNTAMKVPQTRTLINLAPANLRKEGPLYDLGIALGLLGASEQLSSEGCAKLEDYLIAGELSLSGQTRPICGALALAKLAEQSGKKGIVLPSKNADEAALIEGIETYGVDSLDQTIRFFNGELKLKAHTAEQSSFGQSPSNKWDIDFSEVKGQSAVRRAVEVAVAGGHNLLLIGPPGSGKSMLAKRIPTIMPKPTQSEFLEILAVHSRAGITLKENGLSHTRPFRSPHHSISQAGLIGGGTYPGPGEISLAHHGVLFLDELAEFPRGVLDALRQPLEDGQFTLSRSMAKITLPSQAMLVAATNPCPCGHLGDPHKRCVCSQGAIQRYRSRLSGPLLDRIDLHLEVPVPRITDLRSTKTEEPSEPIRKRVQAARDLQAQRFGTSTGRWESCSNARLGPAQLQQYCRLTEDGAKMLEQAMQRLRLSARAHDRILRVARTLADLQEAENIQNEHLLEAIQYRSLDRSMA